MSGPTFVETAIVRVDVMPRSDRGRRRFAIVADTQYGRVTATITQGQDGWQGRFEPVIPPYKRREVVRAFAAWLADRAAG